MFVRRLKKLNQIEEKTLIFHVKCVYLIRWNASFLIFCVYYFKFKDGGVAAAPSIVLI